PDPLSIDDVRAQPLGNGWYDSPNFKWDCIEIDLDGAATGSDDEFVWLPCGPVEQVRIYDNVIRRMGLSGISTSLFVSSVYDWETGSPAQVVMVVIDIDIARIQIEDHVQSKKLPEALSLNFDRCIGGICLAAS